MEKFSMPDTFKQALTREMTRAAELKAKLVRDSENKIYSKLTTMFGNAKLAKSDDTLAPITNDDHSALLLGGKVVVNASVQTNKGSHKVAVDVRIDKNDAILPEDEDLKALVMSSPTLEPDPVTADILSTLPLNADLSKFQLIDRGMEYLEVKHAAYDASLGKVSKNEYNATTDKATLLREMFENQIKGGFVENHFELTFTGSFVEPTVVKEVIREPLQVGEMVTCDFWEGPGEILDIGEQDGMEVYKIKCADGSVQMAREGDLDRVVEKHAEDECKHGHAWGSCPSDECEQSWQAEHASELPEMEDLESKHKMADTFRQTADKEAQRIQTLQDKIVNQAVNAHVAHLRQLGYENIKVGSVDQSALKYDGSFTGDIKIQTTLNDSTGPKEAAIPFTIQGDNFKFPIKETVAKAITEGTNLIAEDEKAIKEEADKKQEDIDKEESWKASETEATLHVEKIEKTAADAGGLQYLGPVNTLNVERHLLGLAEDTEIGTVIFADGSHWKLVSKMMNQLSAGKDDGNIWTFEKLHASPEKLEKKEPENRIQN